jgi:hypothetical protein
LALLPYPIAKLIWFFLNVELAFLSGCLLRDAVPGVSRWIPLVLVPVFLFTVIAVGLGQAVIPMLFLAVLAWRLLDRGWDLPAGAVLVWLTHKPQLVAVLALGVLLWSARRRRLKVILGFLLMLVVLSLTCWLIVPYWLLDMWEATSQTPPPTEYYPWIGTTWFLVLKTFELQGWGLWILYLAVVLPLLAAVVKAAWAHATPLSDVLALGFLAAFFVVPYARHYDFPILLIPLLVLLGGRLPQYAGGALMVVFVLLPYLHFILLQKLKQLYGPWAKLHGEWSFFWVPLLLMLIWLLTAWRGTRQRSSAGLR